MKTMKKLLAIFLAVLMLTVLLPTALADDAASGSGDSGSSEGSGTSSYTITVYYDGYTPEETHTFQAYKVFAGTLSTDGTKLSGVTWGDGVNGSAIISALATSTGTTYADAQAVADALSKQSTAEGYLPVATFKAAVASNLASVAGTSSSGTDDNGQTIYTISGLSAGYYFVQESVSMEGKNDAVTAYMLQVVKNVEVASKTGVPSLVKNVKDNNDSDGTETNWQDSADYDVGDKIPYRLKANLNITSANYSEYTTYTMKFTDTMCDGLSLVTDASGTYAVTVKKLHNGTETDITSATGVSIDKSNEHRLVVTIEDIKSTEINAAYNDEIIVYYYATLNSNAEIGSTGNANVAYLEFSNNPNSTGTGKTPEDKNIVFTYKVTVNKVDGNDEALQGAGFTLYKKISGSTATDGYEAVGTEQGGEGSTLTEFSWLRLDEGDYKLVETTTPDGYNTAADVIFTISATHTQDDGTTNALSLTKLEGGDTFTGTVNTGKLAGKVINLPGNTLPSTGGVGTTMFYVVGSALAIGAFILLVAKKRASRA